MSSDRSPSSRARGFGLIEVMVSASMLMVAMAATLTSVASFEQAYEHERHVTQALHVAEATMEELLYRAANAPVFVDGTSTSGTSYDSDGNPGGTFFSTEWRVNGNVPILNCRELIVTVRWTERGVAKSFSLRTVRT